ncbi:TPA: hypothetical protein ACGO4F_002423, partial [Streptococcus suis]
MIKKCQESKGYGSIRKGIHGAVGVLALGLLFSTTAVVYADELNDSTLLTVSSELDRNVSETNEFADENGAEVSSIIEPVGNVGTPVAKTEIGTGSLAVEAIISTDIASSNSAEESIASAPESNTDLAVNISPTSASATDRAAEVLEDRTAPKLISYHLDKTEYQAGETITLTVEASDASDLTSASASLGTYSQSGVRSLNLTADPSSLEVLSTGHFRVNLTGVIPANRPSDEYRLDYIGLEDSIGNGSSYFIYEQAENGLIPLIVRVDGTVTDRIAPKLISYHLDKTEYRAGETITLTVEASDASDLTSASASLGT